MQRITCKGPSSSKHPDSWKSWVMFYSHTSQSRGTLSAPGWGQPLFKVMPSTSEGLWIWSSRRFLNTNPSFWETSWTLNKCRHPNVSCTVIEFLSALLTWPPSGHCQPQVMCYSQQNMFRGKGVQETKERESHGEPHTHIENHGFGMTATKQGRSSYVPRGWRSQQEGSADVASITQAILSRLHRERYPIAQPQHGSYWSSAHPQHSASRRQVRMPTWAHKNYPRPVSPTVVLYPRRPHVGPLNILPQTLEAGEGLGREAEGGNTEQTDLARTGDSEMTWTMAVMWTWAGPKRRTGSTVIIGGFKNPTYISG